jgi:hypothetical protein
VTSSSSLCAATLRVSGTTNAEFQDLPKPDVVSGPRRACQRSIGTAGNGLRLSEPDDSSLSLFGFFNGLTESLHGSATEGKLVVSSNSESKPLFRFCLDFSFSTYDATVSSDDVYSASRAFSRADL